MSSTLCVFSQADLVFVNQHSVQDVYKRQKVAFAEMVRHEFVDGNLNKERTVFDNGLSITVDFESESYVIEEA